MCMTEGERSYTDQNGYTKTTTVPAECVTQWTHDSVTYKGCAYSTGATIPWCATIVDHNGVYVAGNKGFCKLKEDGGHCELHPECTTDGLGGQQISKCIFPWTLNGVTYDGCANHNNEHKYWCAKKVDSEGNLDGGNWDFCKMKYEGGFCDEHGPRKFIKKVY